MKVVSFPSIFSICFSEPFVHENRLPLLPTKRNNKRNWLRIMFPTGSISLVKLRYYKVQVLLQEYKFHFIVYIFVSPGASYF